jgi:hypothetical protein
MGAAELVGFIGVVRLIRVGTAGKVTRFYNPRPGEQSIPVEFQGAAFRFGHSLVRPSYRANLLGDRVRNAQTGELEPGPFFGMIFDPAGEGERDPVDLRGGARARRRFIGWQTFFNFGGAQAANVRPNKAVDTKTSSPLFNLPLGAIASGDPPTALPQRNLLRHLTWSIPSGQSIARAMNITPLTSRDRRWSRNFRPSIDLVDQCPQTVASSVASREIPHIAPVAFQECLPEGNGMQLDLGNQNLFRNHRM